MSTPPGFESPLADAMERFVAFKRMQGYGYSDQILTLSHFDRFLAAETIGRTRWGRLGTLMGGVLSQPLGQRRILVLPPKPTAADLAQLIAAGATWFVWDLEAEPEVPAHVRAVVAEETPFGPEPGAGFLFLRLR